MLKPNATDLTLWTHLVAFAFAGGGAAVALLLSGFEDEREDLRGLAAAVWACVTRWGTRIAVVLGGVLLALRFQAGEHPFDAPHLPLKLAFAALALLMAELTPRDLAKGRRGSALLFLMFWMLTTVVAVNKAAFPRRPRPDVPPAVLRAAP